jgi:hypothetical protein
MNNYKFLRKPFFFLFNLLFATWLVLKIEEIKPTDFGRNRKFFEPAPQPRIVTIKDRDFLLQMANDYAKDRLDSTALRLKIEAFLTVSDKKEIQSAVLQD